MALRLPEHRGGRVTMAETEERGGRATAQLHDRKTRARVQVRMREAALQPAGEQQAAVPPASSTGVEARSAAGAQTPLVEQATGGSTAVGT